MRCVFTSLNVAEVGLLRGLFESEGVECFTRNEQLSMASGSVPFLECQPELWILKDEDFGQAQEILAKYQDKERNYQAWIYPYCGEKNEGQFGACWKCGHLIDE
ncbi:Putative signal transducing protein [Abditibacterium utsteinense]|uniref:Signal transducing protein n=1 Tax=Abditibacterium utsteinense TaxID=1960156 RepID=A0A2S8SVX2_9BACT|nr:DUF2007 domain-containing protein [Abditibacterium utsteinense]PQV64938.1 Putative signal transducing protein [Abditibacterium utsteinense]